ncbi:MAG: trypsin-like serine protease [Pseudomonadota bacterium]
MVHPAGRYFHVGDAMEKRLGIDQKTPMHRMIRTHMSTGRNWHRVPALAASVLALALASCDAVRIPGINPAGEDTTESVDAAPGSGPAPQPPTTDVATDPASNDTDDLAGGAGSIPPSPGADLQSSTVPVSPAPRPQPPLSDPSIQSLGIPVSSLDAINATRCGLPKGAPPTPTISVQAQALTSPQPESLISTQAVGAAAVQSLTAFPGIVKMEPRRFEGNAITSGHCAATRIAERWFLTAAHCVDDGYDEIQFIAGTPNLRNRASARVFTADTAICHAGYAGRETNFINDLALIRVPEDALPALTTVPVAEFGMTDRPLGQYHYATADMAGWGMTGFNQPLSQLLLSAELSIVSASPSVIVIASRDGSGPCIGDSGGPLYVTEEDGQRTVVGVLSVVEQMSGQNLCEGDYRGRYTNVSGYRQWIGKVMAACRLTPGLCDPVLATERMTGVADQPSADPSR